MPCNKPKNSYFFRGRNLLLVCRIMRKPFQNDVMDDYLASLGMWRKPTARDCSCLFRAVAEQLFHTQAVHENVRDTCLSYMTWNRHKFQQFDDVAFEERIENLKENKEWAGPAEINALSFLYKRDFVVYEQISHPPVSVTHNNFSEKVLLCASGSNHYDSVYRKTYPQVASIAQSIVYELLYDVVFNVDSPLDKAREMMTSKSCKQRLENMATNHEACTTPLTQINHDVGVIDGNHCTTPELNSLPVERKPVPFPFKVAKALCSDIYRNIEYDSWMESKKESHYGRLNELFARGDKCQLTLEEQPGRTFTAHIQDMSEDKGPVTVFIEELGEKHKVPFSCLIPLPQPTILSDSHLSVRKKKGRNRKDLPMFFCPAHLQTDQKSSHYSARNNSLRTPPRFQVDYKTTQCNDHCYPNHEPHATESPSQPVEAYNNDGNINMADELNQGENTWSENAAVVTDVSEGYGMVTGEVPNFSVPHVDNMIGPVNFAVTPSLDPMARDLPHADPSTLRFFFNLGVEYYRLCSSMPPAPPTTYSYPATAAMYSPLPPSPPLHDDEVRAGYAGYAAAPPPPMMYPPVYSVPPPYMPYPTANMMQATNGGEVVMQYSQSSTTHYAAAQQQQ